MLCCMRDDFGLKTERERKGNSRDCFRETLTCIEKFRSCDQTQLTGFSSVPIFVAKYTFEVFNHVICEDDHL